MICFPRKRPYLLRHTSAAVVFASLNRVRYVICDARQAQTALPSIAEDSEVWCVLRTAHDVESIVRPFAFYRIRSEAFDDQFTVFSQKNYRAAQ